MYINAVQYHRGEYHSVHKTTPRSQAHEFRASKTRKGKPFSSCVPNKSNEKFPPISHTGPLYKDPRNHQPPDQHPARRDVRPPAAEHLQDGRGAGRLAGSEPSQPELAPIEPPGATAGNAAGDSLRTVAPPPPPRSPVDRYVTLGFPSTIVIREITASSLHPYPYSKQRAAVYSPKQYASYSSASPNSLTLTRISCK